MESRAEVGEETGETETKRFLRDAMPDLETCARRAFECILAAPTYMPKGFSVSPHMDSPTSFGCLIQAENPRYSSAFSLWMDWSDLEELMPGMPDNAMRMDTLGEIANVIAGSFLGRKSFLAPFGNMLPSPPIFPKGAVSVRESWCIHGALKANGARIFLCFMIKSVQKDADA